MVKLKGETLEKNITRLILLSIVLTITMVALASSASAAEEHLVNTGNGITVDGVYSDWNTDDGSPDYFAPMYEGWNQDPNKEHPILSDLYLRYDCEHDIMYVLVLNRQEDGQYIEANNGNEAWIKISGDNTNQATEVVLGDGTKGNFAWVTDNGKNIGYEASFQVKETDKPVTYIAAHIQVNYKGTLDTTSGTLLKFIPITIVCGPDLSSTLDVTKTVETSYTRTHNWGGITKTVHTDKGFMEYGDSKVWLYTDGSGNENAYWTGTVDYEGYTDSDFTVSGEITILNSGQNSVTINSISDLLGDEKISIQATGVNLPYTLPAGQTLTCEYSYSSPTVKPEGSNLVTVTTADDKQFSCSVPIIWNDPTTEVNKDIIVHDISTNSFSNVVTETDYPVSAPLDLMPQTLVAMQYQQFFAWTDFLPGDYTIHNTASIVGTEKSAEETVRVNVQGYVYETAYAKGDNPTCFTPTFTNWGWTNKITTPGTYTMDLWAGAAQCATSKGTNVGTVTVVYSNDGYVTVTYNVAAPYTNEETHVYAGYDMFPKDSKGKLTVAPGAYSNHSPFTDLSKPIYVITHAKVGIPDPAFGPK